MRADQFYVVVGIMGGMFTMMCAIFGMVIHAATGWQKIKDEVTGVIEDIKNLVMANEKEHDEIKDRVTYLERKDHSALRNQGRRG